MKTPAQWTSAWNFWIPIILTCSTSTSLPAIIWQATSCWKPPCKAGKVKAIGISNFHDEKLEDLLAHAEIKPHVIQLESHPHYTDTKTMDRLKEYGTRMVAWYPLGHGDRALLNEPVFTELAKKYGKSNAQIILRWHVQRGTTVIPGSTNPDHIKANADIFDFELTAGEMATIEKINKNVRYYNPNPEQEAAYAGMKIDLDAQP